MVASVGEAAVSGVSLVGMIAAVILTLFAALATGVRIAMVTDWVCRTSFFVPRMISGKWKTMYKPE